MWYLIVSNPDLCILSYFSLLNIVQCSIKWKQSNQLIYCGEAKKMAFYSQVAGKFQLSQDGPAKDKHLLELKMKQNILNNIS